MKNEAKIKRIHNRNVPVVGCDERCESTGGAHEHGGTLYWTTCITGYPCIILCAILCFFLCLCFLTGGPPFPIFARHFCCVLLLSVFAFAFFLLCRSSNNWKTVVTRALFKREKREKKKQEKKTVYFKTISSQCGKFFSVKIGKRREKWK